MKEKIDIDQMIKSSVQPTGVTVQAADGRVFFLSDEEAHRTAIPRNTLYFAYLLITQHRTNPPLPNPKSARPCARAKAWLDSHSPNSAFWRRLCLAYFDNCL